jgi:anaerobic magnesium-protoporphyrin IX monomethyl ester cyclase
MKKRMLLGASYSVIEPLGLLHLGGLARDEGWERTYHLVPEHDFETFFERVKDFKPDVIGFNVYTGNHIQLHEAFKKLKKDHPNIATVVGGPHPTYFPSESAEIADYVVMSEGFGALRKILRGEAKPGIHPMEQTEIFPHPDRFTFYNEYPEHGRSKIKSFISMTGCPYKCTYCYNSSEPKDIAAPPEIIKQVEAGFSLGVLGKGKQKQGMGGRLFPFNVRSVDDVVKEAKEIVENWPTEVLYCQDDVHGFDIKEWLPELAKRWPKEVGIPYHAQMRWEMTKDEERLDILKEAGCFGLTLAIEAADYELRKEVLDRAMPTDTMYDGMRAVIDRGFRVRTEQITGLPYGATQKPTLINLDADLELLELNVDLREKTGGPTMAWASTLAPYKGTKLGQYCENYGFYNGDNSDVPDTFFERSVLRFLRSWQGQSLENVKDNPDIWLDESDLERYRNQNAELRRNFNFFALVPEGHKLAKKYLESSEPFSYNRLGIEAEEHLRELSTRNKEAAWIVNNLDKIRDSISDVYLKNNHHLHLNGELKELSPYFASLPKSDLAVHRAVKYASERGDGHLTPNVLSTAVRHHLYDEVLYTTRGQERPNMDERYPPKI